MPLSRSLTQMSVEMFVPPVRQSLLKCSYSRAHVGSGCSRTCTCSGGLPLGSTRVRTVNDEGPHLHRPVTCALPFSPTISSVNQLRHDSSVPSMRIIGGPSLHPARK